MLELLTHYEQEFHVRKWNLLVLDECHHCTGNAPYAIIMREYYKKSPDKPRVLGLTASPLINVKKSSTDEQLAAELAKLEDLMDARIASVESLLEQQRQEEGYSDAQYNDDMNLLRMEAKESIVHYVGNDSEQSGVSWPKTDLDNFQLHFCRRAEMRRLQVLHLELGPLPLLLYVPVLYNQFSKNVYEGENEQQLRSILAYLKHIVRWCVVDYIQHGIKSNKFIKLLRILEREIEDNQETNRLTCATAVTDCVSPSATGVVFVQQRITAMALHTYFERRQKALESGEKWPPSAHTIQTLLEAALGNDDEPWEWIDVKREKSNQQPTRDSNQYPCQILDQFDDAEEEHEGFILQTSSNDAPAPAPSLDSYVEDVSSRNENFPVFRNGTLIRCGVLVRQPHRIFKSFRYKRKWNHYPTQAAHFNEKQLEEVGREDEEEGEEEEEEEEETEVETNRVTHLLNNEYKSHGEGQIRSIINGLRSGVINVVIATSVIEEGVDVQSCSFVVVFDQILSIKSYIQMKGRARQENSKFFLFQEIGSSKHRRALALDEARALELRVQKFIRFQERQRGLPDISPDPNISFECDSSDLELLAAKQGIYKADQGTVRLETAKSLLYRYAMKQPLDPAVRKSRESFNAYMPEFDAQSRTLLLPAYIGSGLRHILLPKSLWKKNLKDRQNILSLMACVRLHRHGLLTDRLLPFARKDLRKRAQKLTAAHCNEEPPFPKFMPCKLKHGASMMFLYTIELDGTLLKKARMALKSGETRLAIVLCEPIEFNARLIQHHAEFGELSCNLGAQQKVLCTEVELSVLSQFFAFLMNSRWKRRTEDSSFRHDVGLNDSSVICSYNVGCVDSRGRLDFPFMLRMLKESARSELERSEAAQSVSLAEQLPRPRL
jgi:superfamily II DNA or RNA helicase